MSSNPDSESWSHVGVRIPQTLKSQIEALATSENVSISDLVRRALAMHLAGGPARWLELERQQQEKASQHGRTKDPLVSQVRAHGEWMRSLSPQARLLIHMVGETAAFEEPRWNEEIQLLESGPVPIWCVALEEPVPTELPTEDQVERIRSMGRVITCNPACQQHHPRTRGDHQPDSTDADTLPAALCDEHLMREFIDGRYLIQGRLFSCSDRDRDPQSSYGDAWVVLHLLGERDGGHLTRIWGLELEAHDDLSRSDDAHAAPGDGAQSPPPPTSADTTSGGAWHEGN